jgi:hypothetical protein
VCTALFAGLSSNIRPYTAYMYGSGQPYSFWHFTKWVKPTLSSTICSSGTMTLCPANSERTCAGRDEGDRISHYTKTAMQHSSLYALPFQRGPVQGVTRRSHLPLHKIAMQHSSARSMLFQFKEDLCRALRVRLHEMIPYTA